MGNSVIAGHGLTFVLTPDTESLTDCAPWTKRWKPGVDTTPFSVASAGWGAQGRIVVGDAPGSAFVETCRKGILLQTPWPIEPGREPEIKVALSTFATALDTYPSEVPFDPPPPPAPDAAALWTRRMLVMPDPRVTLQLTHDEYDWTSTQGPDGWHIARSARPDDIGPFSMDIAVKDPCPPVPVGTTVALTTLLPGLTPGAWQADATAQGDTLIACRPLGPSASIVIAVPGANSTTPGLLAANTGIGLTFGEAVATALLSGLGRVNFDAPTSVPNSYYLGSASVRVTLPPGPAGAVYQPVFDAAADQVAGFDLVTAPGVGWRLLLGTVDKACSAKNVTPIEGGKPIDLITAFPDFALYRGYATWGPPEHDNVVAACIAGEGPKDPALFLTMQAQAMQLTPADRTLAANIVRAVRDGIAAKQTRVTVLGTTP